MEIQHHFPQAGQSFGTCGTDISLRISSSWRWSMAPKGNTKSDPFDHQLQYIYWMNNSIGKWIHHWPFMAAKQVGKTVFIKASMGSQPSLPSFHHLQRGDVVYGIGVANKFPIMIYPSHDFEIKKTILGQSQVHKYLYIIHETKIGWWIYLKHIRVLRK